MYVLLSGVFAILFCLNLLAGELIHIDYSNKKSNIITTDPSEFLISEVKIKSMPIEGEVREICNENYDLEADIGLRCYPGIVSTMEKEVIAISVSFPTDDYDPEEREYRSDYVTVYLPIESLSLEEVKYYKKRQHTLFKKRDRLSSQIFQINYKQILAEHHEHSGSGYVDSDEWYHDSNSPSSTDNTPGKVYFVDAYDIEVIRK